MYCPLPLAQPLNRNGFVSVKGELSPARRDDACSSSVLALAVGYRAWHTRPARRRLRSTLVG